MDRTVIESLFDLDFYKLTMQQLQFLLHSDALVKLGFTCRTKGVNLPGVIPVEALREQLAHLRDLRVSQAELEFLRESANIPRGMFVEEYLNFMATLQLPEITVEVVGDEFRIEAEGPWPVVTLVETLVLSTVNEMYNYYQLQERGLDEREELWPLGYQVLSGKIRDLVLGGLQDSLIPQCIVEFGTRRRESRAWQREVTMMMSGEMPHLFAGTSNVRLAIDLDLRPIGTYAHEMDMVYSRLFGDSDEAILHSHDQMMSDWWNLYGAPLSIALSDTYGTPHFLRTMTEEQARNWRGLRHDSGPWEAFGTQRVLPFYKRYGIDPESKVIVWSDGLSPNVVDAINDEFGQRVGCLYGWGTNLTNDFGPDAKATFGVRPLSIVMKAVASMGLPTCKLSDNIAKACGPRDVVERFQHIFGYNPDDFEFEELVY